MRESASTLVLAGLTFVCVVRWTDARSHEEVVFAALGTLVFGLGAVLTILVGIQRVRKSERQWQQYLDRQAEERKNYRPRVTPTVVVDPRDTQIQELHGAIQKERERLGRNL